MDFVVGRFVIVAATVLSIRHLTYKTMEAKKSFFARLKNTMKEATSDGLAEGSTEAGMELLVGEVFEDGEILEEAEADIFGTEMLEAEESAEIPESSFFINSFADTDLLHTPLDEPFSGQREVQ